MSKSYSHIKLSFSRPLSSSEKEFFTELRAFKEDGRRTAFFEWAPHKNGFLYSSLPARMKLSENEQLYVESEMYSSRRLHAFVLEFLEKNFVNIHPTAVKTLKEKS